MAAGFLPPPGTELGPCVPDCAHEDCAETRRMAEALCPHCGAVIGYDTRFYVHPLRHAFCAETEKGRP